MCQLSRPSNIQEWNPVYTHVGCVPAESASLKTLAFNRKIFGCHDTSVHFTTSLVLFIFFYDLPHTAFECNYPPSTSMKLFSPKFKISCNFVSVRCLLVFNLFLFKHCRMRLVQHVHTQANTNIKCIRSSNLIIEAPCSISSCAASNWSHHIMGNKTRSTQDVFRRAFRSNSIHFHPNKSPVHLHRALKPLSEREACFSLLHS